MRNIVLGGLVATAAFAAAPASAATFFTPGVYTVPAYATSTSVRDFNASTNNASGQYNTGAGEAVSGNVFSTSGTLTNTNVNPDGGSDRYLAIQNGTYTLTFGGAGIQFFSFIIGSVDTYNSLTLNFANGTSQTFNGAQITTGSTATAAGLFATNSVGNSNVSGRVTYDFQNGSGLTSAVFGSTQPTFELDDIVTAVPEPAAWALMILGFGLVGSQLRTRRRKTTVAFAA